MLMPLLLGLPVTQLKIRNTHKCIYQIFCGVCIGPAAEAAQVLQQTDRFQQSWAKPRTVIVQLTTNAEKTLAVVEWGLGTLR